MVREEEVRGDEQRGQQRVHARLHRGVWRPREKQTLPLQQQQRVHLRVSSTGSPHGGRLRQL